MSRKFWKDIWDKKGESNSKDLLYLDGYEHLKIDFDSKDICNKIIKLMDIKPGESILEVACGAGFLARELQDYNYVGIDYSKTIVQKHKELFPLHDVAVSESNSIPYGENSYDNVFCFGLFQYLPSDVYAAQTILEMKRVAKKGIFLGDLKTETTRKEHYVYPKNKLIEDGFTISPCLYDSNDVERFNAYCKV